MFPTHSDTVVASSGFAQLLFSNGCVLLMASSGGYREGERLEMLFAGETSKSGVRGLGSGRVHTMPPFLGCLEASPDLSVLKCT